MRFIVEEELFSDARKNYKKGLKIIVGVLIGIFLGLIGLNFPNLLPFIIAAPFLFMFYYIFIRNSSEFSLRNLRINQDVLVIESKKGGKLKGFVMLRIKTIPISLMVREERRRKKAIEKIMIPGNLHYLHYHLTLLAKFLSMFNFELKFSENAPEIRLSLSLVRMDETELIREVRGLIGAVKLIFEVAFPGVKIEQLRGNELRNTWGDVFGNWGDYSFKLSAKDKIQINGKREEAYLTVLEVKNFPIFQLINNRPQMDALIRDLIGAKIDLSYIIAAEPVEIHNFKEYKGLLRDRVSNGESIEFQPEDLESRIKDELINIRHEEKTAFWKVSGYFVVRSSDKLGLDIDITKIKGLMASIFDVEVELLEGRRLRKAFSKIPLRNHLFNPISLSSEQLAILTHFPEEYNPKKSQSDIPAFEIPPETRIAEGIQIGKILLHNREIYPFHLSLEDLKLNVFISGQEKMGKTRCCLNLLNELARTHSEVNWICWDWKGDYLPLLDLIKDQTVYEIRPGSEFAPLRLNFLDPHGSNSEVHARKIYSILRAVFSTDFEEEIEHVIGAESVIKDVLKDIIKTPKKRTLATLINELKYQAKKLENQDRVSSAILTKFANRMQNLNKGLMGEILNVDKSNMDFKELLNRKVVVNMSALLVNSASQKGVQLLMNLLIKYILDKVLEKDVTDRLSYMMVIEKAELAVPAVFREVPETSLLEDIPFLLRGAGTSLVAITSQPQVPWNIIHNSGVKIVFRTEFPYKIGERLNLTEGQEKYLQRLPKREAIVTIPILNFPFRILTDYFEVEMPVSSQSRDTIKNQDRIFEEDQASHFDLRKVQELLEQGPLNKEELIDNLSIGEQDLERCIEPHIHTNQILSTLEPGFDSSINKLVYFLPKDRLWLKNKIAHKIDEEFLRKGLVGKLTDDDLMDYISYETNSYILIYTSTGTRLDLRVFSNLLLKWYENVVDRGGNELIIIVPLKSWASIIKTHLNSYPNIIIFSYQQEDWIKLSSFLTSGQIGSSDKPVGNKF